MVGSGPKKLRAKKGNIFKPATGYVPLYFAITLLIDKILHPDLLSTKPSTFGFVSKQLNTVSG